MDMNIIFIVSCLTAVNSTYVPNMMQCCRMCIYLECSNGALINNFIGLPPNCQQSKPPTIKHSIPSCWFPTQNFQRSIRFLSVKSSARHLIPRQDPPSTPWISSAILPWLFRGPQNWGRTPGRTPAAWSASWTAPAVPGPAPSWRRGGGKRE